jgi:hypothetical protein
LGLRIKEEPNYAESSDEESAPLSNFKSKRGRKSKTTPIKEESDYVESRNDSYNHFMSNYDDGEDDYEDNTFNIDDFDENSEADVTREKTLEELMDEEESKMLLETEGGEQEQVRPGKIYHLTLALRSKS